MDLLEGKNTMVQTFMGNTRMNQALCDYGDRTSHYPYSKNIRQKADCRFRLFCKA